MFVLLVCCCEVRKQYRTVGFRFHDHHEADNSRKALASTLSVFLAVVFSPLTSPVVSFELVHVIVLKVYEH